MEIKKIIVSGKDNSNEEKSEYLKHQVLEIFPWMSICRCLHEPEPVALTNPTNQKPPGIIGLDKKQNRKKILLFIARRTNRLC